MLILLYLNMRYTIEHESRHSIRLHVALPRITEAEADTLEYYLKDRLSVRGVSVSDRTGMVFIKDGDIASCREAVLNALREFSFDDPEALRLVPENSGRALNRKYREKLLFTCISRAMQIIFLPDRMRFGWSVIKSLKFVLKGMKSILGGRVEVSVLDAIAIGVSLLRGDYNTAGSVMFLLDAGEILEEWTHKKSVNDLAGALSLNVDRVWLKTPGGEVLSDVKSVHAGDMIVVHTSNIIPLDGKVVSGEISVNQSSMTGESVPVVKQPGGYVYAGTVVEEGECVIEVKSTAGKGKYDQIVRMIEESGKLKSESEQKAFHLADSLVPYALLGTALTYLLTRNVSRAISFLMVDFSCALKLSMPLTVLSAIKEAGLHNISVKGGKFLEAVSNAGTIVFDKTGTLTKARPRVEKIVTFNGADENEMLRIAACLEEHYPHSMANAIVKEAERRDLFHDEMHSRIEYVVAHGIASEIEGEKAIIGSYHFVFEDEKIPAGKTAMEKLDKLSDWLADQVDHNDYLAGFVFALVLFAIPYIIGVVDIVVR